MGEQSRRKPRVWPTAMTAAVVVVALAWGSAGLAATTSGPAATSKTVVRGWGANNRGALGTGSTSPFGLTPARVKVPKGVSVSAVRAGCDHSVAVTSTGRLLAWGGNGKGQVGDGTTRNRNVPVFVKLPKGTKVTAVRAGCDHSIALTKAGSVLAWGANVAGQLGDGTRKDRHSPVRVKLPKGTKVKAISAGCNDSFALTTTGKLYAWGRNNRGQLGDGTHKNRENPVAVKLPAGATATSVTAGCQHTLALASTGLFGPGLYGWGDNSKGQLGTGDTKSTDLPVGIVFLFRGPGPGKITSIFAGCFHTIALFSKGAILAWGDNSEGQLGDGSPMSSDKPVSVMLPAGVTVRAISAGCFNGYALTTSGQLYAWGSNGLGQLGTGGPSGSGVPVLVHLPAGPGATAIGSGPGAQHAFAISARS